MRISQHQSHWRCKFDASKEARSKSRQCDKVPALIRPPPETPISSSIDIVNVSSQGAVFLQPPLHNTELSEETQSGHG